ncbi:Twinfilin-1 [Steccherinum ochraceum]|uniref:Twinfilin-1 n=1 Tax=Steccherinum ochraceum TaxID=92696 RepID=A0A4R0RLV6_9APHY|nr:Twinfilin-1 [Steccherinum ochraceum]
MSATSGITVSDELTSAFGDAVQNGDVRFLKVIIRNESLVLDDSKPIRGSLEQDFDRLTIAQSEERALLDEKVPAYVLTKLDEAGWLAIFYVPDEANVRDKMLYASTRNNLTKSLGAAHFTDSLFATKFEELTADAYKRHLAHLNAPKPMSEREKEMAAVKAAEREAGGSYYEGSRARRNPLGSQAMGLTWDQESEDAVREMGSSGDRRLVILVIDSQENTKLHSVVAECSPDALTAYIPESVPSYAFYAYPHTFTQPPRRDIVFIYSCPSASPVRQRMIYSSAFLSTYRAGKVVLGDAGESLVERKIETSDPKELNEEFLKFELGLTSTSAPAGSGAAAPASGGDKAFARPKGPGRKR